VANKKLRPMLSS